MEMRGSYQSLLCARMSSRKTIVVVNVRSRRLNVIAGWAGGTWQTVESRAEGSAQ